ncbi:MAG: ISKra4 family transposase [Anaerolineae bacterium]
MLEQQQLLDQMLACADGCVKHLCQQVEEVTASDETGIAALEMTVFETMLRLGATLLGLILSSYATGLAEASATRRPCHCGGMMRWVSLRTKTILSLLGKVTYTRVYFHCEQCGHGEALGDRHWGLQHTRTTAGVVQLLGYLSAGRSFADTAREVCRILCWPQEWLSGKQVQRLAQSLGQRLEAMDAERIAEWWRLSTVARSGTAEQAPVVAKAESVGPIRRLYVQMDGIMVRFRGKAGKGSDPWHEVKVGAVFVAEMGRHISSLAQSVAEVAVGQGQEVCRWVDRPQGVISYVAGRMKVAEFGIRLYAEAVGRGLERAEEVVILGDGAHWIWQLAEEHFPGAVQILDFWHASEWVWKVAKAVWGEGSARATEWAERQMAEHLIKGDAEGLVAAIGVLPRIPPPPGANRSIPEQAAEYFRKNAGRMRYPEYRARGMEIGSGTVESAGKRVVGQRCKGPGMRWSEGGLPPVLELRTKVLNERFDSAIAALPKAS